MNFGKNIARTMPTKIIRTVIIISPPNIIAKPMARIEKMIENARRAKL